MRKDHTCDIIPLRDQDWYEKTNHNGIVMMSQCINNIQVLDATNKERYKYYDVANPGQRGGVCGRGTETGIYDICYNPAYGLPVSKNKMVKNGYLAIIKEKIVNDLNVYKRLIDEMGISDPDIDITMEDVSKYMLYKDELQVGLEKALGNKSKK